MVVIREWLLEMVDEWFCLPSELESRALALKQEEEKTKRANFAKAKEEETKQWAEFAKICQGLTYEQKRPYLEAMLKAMNAQKGSRKLSVSIKRDSNN